MMKICCYYEGLLLFLLRFALDERIVGEAFFFSLLFSLYHFATDERGVCCIVTLPGN